MSDLKKVAAAAEKFALEEIRKYGAPSKERFQFFNKKGLELAKRLGANEDIVYIGTCLMNVKVGEAASKGISDTKAVLEMDMVATKEFLKHFDLGSETEEKILNCVEAHSGLVEFRSLEAEICRNTDCYGFLHPVLVLRLFYTIKFYSFHTLTNLVKGKVEEKWRLLTIDICKKELEPYYKAIKTLLSAV